MIDTTYRVIEKLKMYTLWLLAALKSSYRIDII